MMQQEESDSTSLFRKKRQEIGFPNNVQETVKLHILSFQMSSHCMCTSIYMHDERRMWEFFNHFHKSQHVSKAFILSMSAHFIWCVFVINVLLILVTYKGFCLILSIISIMPYFK